MLGGQKWLLGSGNLISQSEHSLRSRLIDEYRPLPQTMHLITELRYMLLINLLPCFECSNEFTACKHAYSISTLKSG